MNQRMIENSDRGITLNKPLAWTIFSSLALLIWWGGTTLTSLQTAIATLTVAISESRDANMAMDMRMRAVEKLVSVAGESREAIVAVEQRVRIMENTQTRVDAQFSGMRETLQEIRDQNRAIEQLVRQYLQVPKP